MKKKHYTKISNQADGKNNYNNYGRDSKVVPKIRTRIRQPNSNGNGTRLILKKEKIAPKPLAKQQQHKLYTMM
jgi:hypothetical protein